MQRSLRPNLKNQGNIGLKSFAGYITPHWQSPVTTCYRFFTHITTGLDQNIQSHVAILSTLMVTVQILERA